MRNVHDRNFCNNDMISPMTNTFATALADAIITDVIASTMVVERPSVAYDALRATREWSGRLATE